MTIKKQKSGEALEDRVKESEFVLEEEEELKAAIDTIKDSDVDAKISDKELDAAVKIMAALPTEEKENVDMDEDSPELVPESSSSEVDSVDVQEGVVEEPIQAPVGPADYSTSDYISPQKLEEAHTFLNRYGIKTDHLTPKEVMAKIDKIHIAKEENAQVLSRGRALDGIERLLAFVPEGFIGEFKRENDMDINRAEALGFKVFIHDEAKLASSTGAADGRVKLGDQILMIIPEELHVANRLIKAERLAERRKSHDPKGKTRIDQSEADPLFPLIKL